MGQPVMVKMSEAEKNLAWEAAEQAKRLQREMGVVAPAAAAAPSAPAGAAAAQTPQVPQGPARLVLSNLPTSITGGCMHVCRAAPVRLSRAAWWPSWLAAAAEPATLLTRCPSHAAPLCLQSPTCVPSSSPLAHWTL